MSRGSSPCSFVFENLGTLRSAFGRYSPLCTEFSAQLGWHQRLEPRRRFAARHDVSLRFLVLAHVTSRPRAKGSSLAAQLGSSFFSIKASRRQIDVVIFHQSADGKRDDARKARRLSEDGWEVGKSYDSTPCEAFSNGSLLVRKSWIRLPVCGLL